VGGDLVATPPPLVLLIFVVVFFASRHGFEGYIESSIIIIIMRE